MSDETSSVDERYLRRCVELATQALENGDDPFGSVLVDADGATLAEALNREQSDRDPSGILRRRPHSEWCAALVRVLHPG